VTANLPVTTLRGVGEALAARLRQLGVESAEDLLFLLPLRYEDRTRVVPLGELRQGERAAVEGEIQLTEIAFRGRRQLLCRIADGSGFLTLRFFHFSAQQQQALTRGARLRCFGEARRGAGGMEFVHPEYRRIDPAAAAAAADHLTPIYPSTEGLTQGRLRQLVGLAIDGAAGRGIPDLLPPPILAGTGLPSLREALLTMHRPPADAPMELLLEGRHPAQRRLAFEELLAHQLSLRLLRQRIQSDAARPLAGGGALRERLLAALPFRLTGAHQTLACDACHVGGHYKSTPKSCVGCRETDDEHRGSRGPDCGKCHVTKEWKTAKYDHLKETGFALLGVHDRIDCLACHRSGNYKDKIPKTCDGCHAADDAHAKRFGSKCEDCHENEHWHLDSYDHAGRHHFALIDAHAKIDCYACHTANVATQKLAKECAGCHRAEDPHGGKLKDGCGACHGQKSWRGDIAFDHDLTKYPLLGLHRVVSCAQCHSTLAFDNAPTNCVDCHSHEDVHKGGLGKKCESCHSPNGWALWAFDHGKQTHFPLLGAHAKLKCADCHHVAPGTTKTPSECGACHRKDDRHLGEYGEKCDRCHTVYSWKGARMQ